MAVVYLPTLNVGAAAAPAAAAGAAIKIFRQIPPETLPAATVFEGGASTPAENFHTLAFDDGTDEFMDYECLARVYNGGGLTARVVWAGDTAVVGVTGWELAIRVLADADLRNVSHSYVFEAAPGSTVPDNVNKRKTLTWNLLDGAQIDGLAVGDYFYPRIKRNTSIGSNMVGDALLWQFNLEET